jgi:hypothetical protein
VTKTFFLTVNKFNFPPTISAIGPQFVTSGGTTPEIPFTVTSPVQTTFTVVGESGDTTLVPNANIVVTHGTGANYTVRATALNVVPGPDSKKTTITVRATDAATGAFSTRTFDLTVLPPRERTYTNSAPITISDASAANPYPSTIKVSDLLGAVSQVTATLRGFTHTFPSDVGVLLVGPTGQKLVLMNRAGQGGADANGIWLKFDQTSPTAIPASGALTAGSFKPADYRGGTYNFPPPAPEGSYPTNSLDAFNGLTANGTWSLYVYDDALGDVGIITNGWSLGITTQPIIIGLTNVYMLEDAVHTQPFTVADDSRVTPSFTFTKTSSKTDIIPVNNITITQVGSSGVDFTVTVDPAGFGSNVVIGITAQNADGQTVSKSFTVDVGYKATPPVIADIPNQTMNAGSVLSVPVNYSDAHTPKDQLDRSVVLWIV